MAREVVNPDEEVIFMLFISAAIVSVVLNILYIRTSLPVYLFLLLYFYMYSLWLDFLETGLKAEI